MTRTFSPIAKISLPVFSGVFPRKKLFRALDKAMKHPSVWISGPAGCGKTALASTYLSARKIPCLWYRLDESDNDVASFFYYMGLAARAYEPGKGKTLPLLTPEYLPGLSSFSKKYFEDLFGRLKPGSVVVFDDYQKVGTRSLFHKAICDGLSRLPDGIHAFFISRGDPPPIFARERAHQRMECLGWKELRLTPVEAKGITRLRGKKLNAGEVLSLQDRSDGWAAGLVLLLEESAGPATKRLKMTDNPPEKVFEYFAGEIFTALGEKTKHFLLKSACLPKMTARMAERITGVSRADAILSYLNRNNYFTEVHPHPEPVYEYHPLFREFLLARAREILPARHLRRILHNAGTALEDAGNDEDAVRLYRELGDREGVARIILRKAPRLILQGRSGTLAEWIDFLPETECAGNPWLLYWRGICRLASGSPECLGDFEEAFRRFRRRKEPEGIFRALAGAVDANIYGGTSLKAVDAWFSTLSGLLRTHNRFPVSRSRGPRHLQRGQGACVEATPFRRHGEVGGSGDGPGARNPRPPSEVHLPGQRGVFPVSRRRFPCSAPPAEIVACNGPENGNSVLLPAFVFLARSCPRKHGRSARALQEHGEGGSRVRGNHRGPLHGSPADRGTVPFVPFTWGTCRPQNGFSKRWRHPS